MTKSSKVTEIFADERTERERDGVICTVEAAITVGRKKDDGRKFLSFWCLSFCALFVQGKD